MNERRIMKIKWHLDDDGGGEAYVFVDYGSHVDELKHVFDSLNELPKAIADAIREDGRTEGELPTPPASGTE